MQHRTIVIIAAVALAGAAAVTYQLTRPSAKPAPAAATAGSAAADGGARAPLLQARAAPSAATLAAPSAPAPAAEPAAAPAPGASVRVARGATVAKVNGVAITGGDLLAFRAGTGEAVEMTPEMHEFLVQRAIDRELTLQAAKAREVELSDEQRGHLAQVRANAAERGETDAAQVAFEEREASAQMLLQTLATTDGAPPAMVDDGAVDRYLREHAGEPGPAASDPEAIARRRVDARQRLYAEQAQQHDARVAALLAALAKQARIER